MKSAAKMARKTAAPHANSQAGRLLIVGTGDIAQRALPQLVRKFTVFAMTRSEAGVKTLSGMGVTPVLADLDRPDSLRQLPVTDVVLHSAPPQLKGARDDRTRHLVNALEHAGKGAPPSRVVYISTSGVYGDCRGAHVDESRLTNPGTDRARRRCDAEQVLTDWTGRLGAALVVLRAPGIYGDNRFPLNRLRGGTPVLTRDDDVFTNHIHAEDLAGICIAALDKQVPGGIYNTVDDSAILMGDWMDLVADGFGLPRPPRVPRSEARARIPAPMLSFMSESRRLVNGRLKRDMGYVLRFPTVADGVKAAVSRRKVA